MSVVVANPWAAIEKFAPGGKGKLQMSAWSVPSAGELPALPPNWFKEDMEDLSCVICLEVPLQPASCPHCKQLSCMSCAKQWFSSPTGQQCPMCRKDTALHTLTTRYSNEDRAEMEGRTATCPLCEWEGTAFDVGDHLMKCPMRPSPCPNAGCKCVLRHKDIQQHVQTACAESRTTCPHCRKPFKGERGRMHINSCPKEVVKCPREGCLAHLPRKDLVGHQKGGGCPTGQNPKCTLCGQPNLASGHRCNLTGGGRKGGRRGRK